MTRAPLGRVSLAAPVRTQRLVLRGVVPADAEAMLAYRSMEDLSRYVPFEPMDRAEIDRRMTEQWGRREITGERDGEGVLIGIQRADTGELIGDVSLWLASTEHRGAEIGWVLHPGHGGQGFATEAAHGVLHLAFDRVRVHRVTARVDARNTASLALCERLGMRREAELVENEWFKGEWGDEFDYALLEREWALQHAGPSEDADGAGAPVSCRWPLVGG